MNVAEVTEIRIDIQRQPVHGNKMTASHSHGTNLAFPGSSRFQPHSGGSVHPSRFNAVRRTDPDDRFFQQMQIFLQSQMKIFQVQNRITHQLSGTMISNVPSAVNMKQGSSDALQLLFTQQHIGCLAVAA